MIAIVIYTIIFTHKNMLTKQSVDITSVHNVLLFLLYTGPNQLHYMITRNA